MEELGGEAHAAAEPRSSAGPVLGALCWLEGSTSGQKKNLFLVNTAML